MGSPRTAQKQILRPAHPTAWGPKRANSHNDTAFNAKTQGTTEGVERPTSLQGEVR